MSVRKIDKKLVEECFRKSIVTYKSHATVQQDITLRLINQLDQFPDISFNNVLEIGCGTGFLTKELVERYPVKHFFINDLVADFEDDIRELVGQKQDRNIDYLVGDIEEIDIPQNLDVIISTSTFQWITQIKELFDKLQHHLSSNGYLIFSTFGINNFNEIKSIEKIGLYYYSFEEIKNRLKQNFTLLYAGEEEIVKHFEGPRAVLQHIKQTGVNALQKKKWTKSDLIRFENKYNELYSDENGVRLTYHPMYFIAKPR